MLRNKFLQDEDKRQKEELIKVFLKEKSKREAGFSRLNELKITQQWRALQREAKSKELQQDVGIMKENFEQLVSQKDAMIALLREELSQSDQQYTTSFNWHARQLEQLIGLKSRRAEATCEHFVTQLETMRKYYNGHQDEIEHLQKYNFDEIDEMKINHHERHLDLEAETAHKYIAMEEAMLEKVQDDKQRLRNEMDVKMGDLWQELQTALQSYLVDTKDSQDMYDEMEKWNRDCLQEIEDQKKKIGQLNDSISYLKQSISETEEIYKEKLDFLNQRKAILKKQVDECKVKLQECKSKQRVDLGKLVQWSDKAIEKMKEIAEKVNKILKLHALCSKLEPEFVHEISYYGNVGMVKEPEAPKLQEFFIEIEGDFSHIELMDNFWKKYNAVLSKTMDLEFEVTTLKEKNEELQQCVRERLINLTSGGSNDQNRYDLQLEKPPSGTVNVIDARDIINQQRRK